MTSRPSLLLLSAVLSLIPAAGFAQSDSPAAPPEVDKALRANVTEFFQDFVDKKYRQAINFVADDTQDKYFASPKAEITEFKIDSIDYSTDFSQAKVKMTVTRIWRMKAEGFMQDANVPGPMDTTWKIENGKWVFFEGPPAPGTWVTPMGPSAMTQQTTTPADGLKKINDGTMAAEAQRILSEKGVTTGITPSEISFAKDKPSTVKVVFRNGLPGEVGVTLEGLPKEIPGLSFKWDRANVAAGGEATVSLSYDPSAGPPPVVDSITVAVLVEPLDHVLPLKVSFTPQQ